MNTQYPDHLVDVIQVICRAIPTLTVDQRAPLLHAVYRFADTLAEHLKASADANYKSYASSAPIELKEWAELAFRDHSKITDYDSQLNKHLIRLRMVVQTVRTHINGTAEH